MIPDYQSIEDRERIVELFGDLVLLTGGSGILEPLAKYLNRHQDIPPELDIRVKGAAILIAGSCFGVTLGQVAHFQTHSGLGHKTDPMVMLEGRESLGDTWRFTREG